MPRYATAIHWFRRDLRLSDNPALFHAAKESERIVPVYVQSVWQGAHAPGGRAVGTVAAKRGLPLLTAAYKPATPQRPPLCTFAPSRPLKHHGPIP